MAAKFFNFSKVYLSSSYRIKSSFLNLRFLDYISEMLYDRFFSPMSILYSYLERTASIIFDIFRLLLVLVTVKLFLSGLLNSSTSKF